MTDNDSELYDLQCQVTLLTERLGTQITETAKWQGKYDSVRELYTEILGWHKPSVEDTSPAIQLNPGVWRVLKQDG